MNGPPKPPGPHVPGIYRYTATALGAGMWFWVSRHGGSQRKTSKGLTSGTVDVQSKEGRSRPDGLEAPLGSLDSPRRGAGERRLYINYQQQQQQPNYHQSSLCLAVERSLLLRNVEHGSAWKHSWATLNLPARTMSTSSPASQTDSAIRPKCRRPRTRTTPNRPCKRSATD